MHSKRLQFSDKPRYRIVLALWAPLSAATTSGLIVTDNLDFRRERKERLQAVACKSRSTVDAHERNVRRVTHLVTLRLGTTAVIKQLSGD
jgi:predicted O-methyltransferase YrrM